MQFSGSKESSGNYILILSYFSLRLMWQQCKVKRKIPFERTHIYSSPWQGND